MSSVSAIDVGSNAIRMAVGALDGKGRLCIIDSYRETVRLGEDVFRDGVVSELTVERGVEAFLKFKRVCDSHRVKKIRAVGTSALREAWNRDYVIRRIEERVGIAVEVIEGQEEARLIHQAVAHHVSLADKVALLVDIGGGSIEISIITNGDLVFCDSVKMGTVRLLQLLGEKKHGQRVFQRLVREYSDGLKRVLKRELGKRSVNMVVGTGGNCEALGQLRVSLLGKNDPKKLDLSELEQIGEELQRLSYQERIEMLSLKPDRADVILPASIVLTQVVRQSGAKELYVPGVGLKEGILVEMLSEFGHAVEEQHAKQVRAFALELGRRFGFDEDHGKNVSRLSLALFDQLQQLHGLNEEWRLVLELGALLHDIGQCISLEDHHKHSYYLLRSLPFVGVTPRERQLIAAIARYHRKGTPKLEQAEFSVLKTDDRRDLIVAIALLRVGDSLDREHGERVEGITVATTAAEIELQLRGDGDFLLERWAVAENAALFEQSFARRLKIK